MTEHDMQELLAEAIEEREDVNVVSFAEAGILTLNMGLVVRIAGAEFQITIVRSR